MTIELLFYSLILILALLQVVVAAYLLLLDIYSTSNRTLAAFLFTLATINLANNILQSTFTLKEATPWIVIEVGGLNVISPLLYLASVATLRPLWLKKYRWFYRLVTGVVFLPILVLVFDLTSLSSRLWNTSLLLTLPIATQFTTGNAVLETAEGGVLHSFFFYVHLVFSGLVLICPSLVVAWKDRTHAPQNALIALFYFLATLLTVLFQGRILPLADNSITLSITSVVFFSLTVYITLVRTSFDDQTRQVQRVFRKWSVFWKLMGAISLIIFVISFAVGITTLTVLKINITRSEGRKLSVLALAQSRNIGDELLNEITQLGELANNPLLITTVDLQNRQYRLDTPETIEDQLTQQELAWQASPASTLTTNYLERYLPIYNALLDYQTSARENELIYLVDNHGAIVTGTTPPAHYRANELPWWRDIFIKGQNDIYLSPLYYDSVGQKYYIEIAIPILDAFYQPLGVLYSQYNIQTLLERITSIQFGETGKAALINSLGLRLSPTPDVAPKETGLDWISLQNLDQSWSVVAYEGQDHLLAWTDMGTLYPKTQLQNLHWRIIYTQSIAETLTPIRLINLTSNLVLAGAIIAAIFIAGILTRIITYPLKKLNSNAAQISQGNLTIQAEELTEDEFGTLAVSFNTMARQLQNFISNLENQVQDRTHALQQRANQIRAAVTIGNTVASIRDIDELLPKVTQLISEGFSFYHVGIFILSEDQEYAVLRAANSVGGQRMLARQHQLKVGEVGIVGYVAKHKLPRIALDVGEDAVFFNNQDLPETRSEMSLPIVTGGRLIGVLDVQSTQAQAFTQEDISILQLLADQLAVVIENANLFRLNEKALAESQTALETARRAYRDLSREGWQKLARESRNLSYRATSQGVTANAAGSSASLNAVKLAHPTLPQPNTLALPIKIQDHVAGVMQLKKEGANSWSAKEISLIENIVGQLGAAIESARLYKETQASLVRTESLYQVIRAATSYEKTEELLLAVADTIAGTLPAHRVLIGTLDLPSKKVLHFIENNAAPQDITPELFDALMNGLTGWAIRHREPALSAKGVPDQREDKNAQKHREENALGSIVVVPMFYQERAMGTITAIKKFDEPDFSLEDVELLTAMANQLAAALINGELLIQTRKRALQLETSTDISRALSSILELDRLLPQVVESLRTRFAYYFVGLFLLDEEEEWAELRAAVGENNENPIPAGFRFPLDNTSYITQVILAQKGRILLDVGVDAIVFENPYLPASRSEIILPLNSRGRTMGALSIQSDQPLAFDKDDLNVFQVMVDQIASAIDNATLFEANNRRLLTSTTLLEITQVASTSLQLTQILSEIAQRTAKATQAYRCMVYLLDQNNHIHPTMAQFADGHMDPKQWELFKSLTAGPLTDVPLFVETINRRRPILLTNLSEHVDLVPLELIKPFHQQTLLTVPLVTQDRGIGILMLDQISPIHTFNQEQINLTVTIAGQAAAIIENARLFQEQEQRSQELKQLNEISLELSQRQMDLAPAIATLSQRAMQLLDSDGGGLWFWDETTRELELVHSFQQEGEHLVGRKLKLGEGLAGKAMQDRTMLVIEDYLAWVGHAQPFTTLAIHAALAVPLIQQGAPLGVLVVNRSQPGKLYTIDQQNLALLLGNQAASFVRTARLFQETQEALQREQKERRIATILAHAAESLGTAYGETDIRQVMLEEIREVVLPEQIILYEWDDTQNAFRVDRQIIAPSEKPTFSINEIITPESREDLWRVFSTNLPHQDRLGRPDQRSIGQYVLPWMSGQRPMGVLELLYSAQALREQDQESMKGIIRLAAISIQSARLFEQTQEALTRTEALYQVSQATTAMESLPILLQSIVDHIADGLPADRVLLITLDTESQQVTSFVESGMPTGSIVPLAYQELMQGLTGWVMQERKPALSIKARKDERESEEVYQHRLTSGAGSIVVVPLLYRERILGTMTATNDLENPDFNQEDVNLLTAMASQAAAAIENARLFNQTQRRALLLQTAAEVSNAASSILELNQLLPEVVELIRERFSLYYVGIFLVDEPRRYAVLRAGTGDAGRIQIAQNHRLRLNTQSMIGRCILDGKAQITQEIGSDTVFFKNPYLPETRSELALPVSTGGQALGAMTIQSIHPAAFSPDDITVLETLVDQLAVAIENARFVAETRIRAENEQLLNQITTQISRSLDLETILQTAVKEIGQLSHVHEVAIHLGELALQPDSEDVDSPLTDSYHDLRMPSADQN